MKKWIVLGITLSSFGLLSACQESSPVANNEEAATARDLPVLSFDQAAAELESPADEPVAMAPTATLDNIKTVNMTKTAEPVEAQRTNVSANATYQQQHTENQATLTANMTQSTHAERLPYNKASIALEAELGGSKEISPASDSDDDADDD